MRCSLSRLFFLWIAILTGAAECSAYSVFTHEQLIDLTWNSAIRPLLLKKFPAATPAQLDAAHAFAYGGCAIQDLGYYPFAQSFFSDLTHYVRTGDFINSLLRNARTVDEYAFALGALSHYIGDTVGHQDAINLATGIEFPKLARKFGPSVTYDQNPHAHVRTEFGFDVDQLSQHRLAPGAYLRFIGLRVSRDLLDRAFAETYALPLPPILGTRRPTFHSYRWAVRSFLPRIAYAETTLHRDQFLPDTPGPELDVYLQHLATADFQKIWNRYRKKPGFKTKIVAFLLRILPKVGPLAEAAIRIPTTHTEDLYIRSVNRSVSEFGSILLDLQEKPTLGDLLSNRDLDTGRNIRPGEYPLTDKTYAKLLEALTKDPPGKISRELKDDILAYYADPSAPISTKKDEGQWRRVLQQLEILRNIPADT